MEIKPAATVLVVRETQNIGIEILLLKRNSKLKFAPDFWVFPGGRIDPEDGSLDQENILHTAAFAAVREAKEEAGINLNPNDLHHFCHWTTPSGGNRRFATWFFHSSIGSMEVQEVEIDDSEIVDHLWISPQIALQRMSKGSLSLLPPTFITLERIKTVENYPDVIKEFDRTGIVNAAPVTRVIDGVFYCLYKGDAGYDKANIHAKNQLHRLIIDQKNGRYEFMYDNCPEDPVNGGAF